MIAGVAPKPKLSVVMPVFNAGTTVSAAVHSVLASEFEAFEFVVLDDGSTDDTFEVVRSIRDPRVKLIRQPHAGVAPAMNAAVRACTTPIIARMDADDLCTPSRLGSQFAYLNGHPVDAVGGMVRVVDRSGAPVPSWRRYERWINSLLDPRSIAAFRFVESPIVNPTVMARRAVYELGFRTGPWPEDYDLWLRAIDHGFRIAKLDEQVLDWVDHPPRLTRVDDRYSPAAFDRCRRMHLLAGPLRLARTVDLWGAGQTGKPWLRWLQSEGVKVRQVIDVAPQKIGTRIHATPVMPPDRLSRGADIPLIIAVGASGAREQILNYIVPLGFEPGRDAWFVA